jgi:hypothetical protein
VAWLSVVWACFTAPACRFSMSTRLWHLSQGESWWLTSVYGPSTDAYRPDFLGELHDLQSLRSGPWLLTSDFNLIYHAKDKNNSNLKELHLNGQLFTWSSERAHPTLERIDHTLVSKEWDKLYLNNDLQSLALISLITLHFS